jgi:mono/diheme cytochrome c family protein
MLTRAALLLVIALVALGPTGHSAASAQGTAQAEPGQGPVKPVIIQRVYDIQQLLKLSGVADDVQRGRVLWLQRCAFCHDGVGQPSYKTMGPWLGAETVRTIGEPALAAIITAGTARMPEFRDDLTAQQVRDLITWLKTVPSDQKPTPAQLAGRGALGGPSGSD